MGFAGRLGSKLIRATNHIVFPRHLILHSAGFETAVMNDHSELFSDDDQEDDTAELAKDAEDEGSARIPSPDEISDKTYNDNEETMCTVPTLAESLLGRALFNSK